jgi:DNA-directed RNA polymerase subunit RPC12/RpoP
MASWYECRYCDGGFRSVEVDGDRVCANCGAEWNSILIEERVTDGTNNDQ